MPRCKAKRCCGFVLLSFASWFIIQLSLVTFNRQDYEEVFSLGRVHAADNPISNTQGLKTLKEKYVENEATTSPKTENVVREVYVEGPVVKSEDDIREENYLKSMRELSNVVEKARKVHDMGIGKTKLSEDAILNYDAHQIDRLVNNWNRLKLFVAILSKPVNHDRRIVIRQSWLQLCRSKEIICKFFTNGDVRFMDNLIQEQEENKDLELLETSTAPVMSGARQLQIFKWVSTKHDPEYLLILFDDRFLCVKRLLYDLEFRKDKFMVWGSLWCQSKEVRMKDGFLVIHGDLVKVLLSDEASLLCHPYADQQLAIWVNNMKNLVYFDDSSRLYSYQIHKNLPKTSKDESVCLKYVSVHGVPDDEMQSLWNNSRNDSFESYVVPPVVNNCQHPKEFNWTRVCDTYKVKNCHLKSEPKLCKDNPKWQ